MSIPPEPDFQSKEFLEQDIRSISDFYEPNVLASSGGFHQCYLDNGEVFDTHSRQLVGSSRFVFNYSMAYRLYGDAHYCEVILAAEHKSCLIEPLINRA